MFETELLWYLTVCKQRIILMLNWIVWNKIICMKMDLALITHNGWYAIKPNHISYPT